MFKTIAALACIGSLAACASTQPSTAFGGERTVFDNPYADPVIANGPVGPEQCGAFEGQQGCWLDGLFYPGKGSYAYDRDGNRVSLSRSERRAFREQAFLVREQARINRLVAEFNARQAEMPPPPEPSAPPIATPEPEPKTGSRPQ